MKRSRVVIGLTATALVLPLGTLAPTAGAAVMPSGSVVVAEEPPAETPPTDVGGGDSAPDVTPNVGLGPVVSGDGSTVAFESVAPLTADDLNTVQSTCTPEVGKSLSGVVPMADIYAYDMDDGTLRRVTMANATGADTAPVTGEPVVPTEATGFKIDGHTGECVPATNGADPALSTDGSAFAFVSGGNLVGRVIAEEEGEVVPTAEGGGTTDGTAIEPNVYKNAGPETTAWVSDDGGSAGRELPAISGDGRYVVLVGRSKAFAGVYIKDTESDEPAVRVASGFLFNPDISVDGNTVAWAKYGSGDTGGQQIYVLDKANGQSWADVAGETPELVSVSDDEVPADGVTDFPSLNEDGSLVAFQSMDKTLDADAVAGAQGGGPNKAYVRDRTAGTTEMVSLVDGEDGEPDTIINGQGIKPVITPDGKFVAFASDASGLQGLAEEEVATAAEEEEETTYQQVYVRDLTEDETLEVSLALDETDPADGLTFGDGASSTSYGPSISDDGRYVAFESDAANLVADDTNGDTDAFVRDMETGTTVRISLDENGGQPDLDPDAGPPESKAFGKPLTNRSPLTVTYTADDPVYPSLGVTEVRLYVKRPGETTFTLRQSDKGTGMDGAFTVRTGGTNGVYAFMTQAVDGQGNVEELPGVGDARTRLDSVAPTIKGLRVVPGSFDISSDRKASINTRVPQSAKRTVVIKHDGIVIKTYRTRMTAAGLLTQVWYGRNDAGVRVHGGRYVAVLRATDLAGNTSRKAVVFTVTR